MCLFQHYAGHIFQSTNYKLSKIQGQITRKKKYSKIYTEGKSIKRNMTVKSYVRERALCYTTLIHSIIVLMATFIALNMLYYFGTNRKCNKKKICSMICEKAHCPFQKSIIKAAGQILTEHKWDASPSPSIPSPPSHWSTGYKSACVP